MIRSIEHGFRICDGINALLLLLAKVAICLMAIHIVVDVSMRVFSDSVIEGTIEIASNYYMVAIAFLALPFIQKQENHIVADFFSQRLGIKWHRIMAIIISFVMAAFLTTIAVETMLYAIKSTARQDYIELTFMRIYKWPAEWLIPVSFLMSAIIALLQGIQAVARLWAHKP